MVTDRQVKRLMNLLQSGKTLSLAADKARMDEKTARKYRDSGQLPSQSRVEHTWKTRPDPFAAVWAEIKELISPAAKHWRNF